MKEQFIAKRTLGDGSVWDIAFSKDPQQKYLYLADGKNERVYVMDRESLQILTSFGDGGRQPGQFFAVHSIATDSKGNIYTTETYEGKRLQNSSTRAWRQSRRSIKGPYGGEVRSQACRGTQGSHHACVISLFMSMLTVGSWREGPSGRDPTRIESFDGGT